MGNRSDGGDSTFLVKIPLGPSVQLYKQSLKTLHWSHTLKLHYYLNKLQVQLAHVF